MTSDVPISLDHDVFESAMDCARFLASEETDGRLYRGEPRPYPKTCPGTRRILEDPALHFQERSYWIDLAGHFEDWFQEYTGRSLDTAQMFLQHYGVPTDLLDFTSDPEIALFLASLSEPEELGMICTMDAAKASAVCDVIDLAQFELMPGLQLQRPRKQSAFAWRHQPGIPSDLKADEARKLFGLRWYAFRKPDGAKYVERFKHNLQVDDDKVALYVIAYAADFGLSTWHQADIGLVALRGIFKQMILSHDWAAPNHALAPGGWRRR